MQNFKFGGVKVLAVQLFNMIKRKEKKMTKNMKKHVSLYFPDVMLKYIYFIYFIYLFILFIFCFVLIFDLNIFAAKPCTAGYTNGYEANTNVYPEN